MPVNDESAPKSEPEKADDREIICVVDPMCSWCWGFSPVIAAMQAAYGDRAPVWPLAGGLRPMTSKPMTDKAKAETRHHWEDVARASGQPFNFTFFDREGFVYDTEPPCRAMVTVRTLRPDRALAYLDALHRAFYAENRDITDPALLADLAGGVGLDRNLFAQVFPTREMMYQTAADFYRAQSMGIQGFPTVVLRNGTDLRLLVAGFVAFDRLRPHLDAWVAGKADTAPAAEVSADKAEKSS
jgi:putative protein-disulfide isomerase